MDRLVGFVAAVNRGFDRLLGSGDRGATAAEYALMAALIAAVIVLSVAAFGGGVLNLFESANAKFP
jgi:pilus assembly protein Flp/PilA